MLKKSLATLALLASMIFPAQADAVVESLLLRRAGDNVNARVTVRNPIGIRQRGPVVIDLYVRATEADEWVKVKTWNDIKYIGAGNRVSRDFFDENSALLRGLAASGRFQARATVRAPGLRNTVERISWYDSESGE